MPDRHGNLKKHYELAVQVGPDGTLYPKPGDDPTLLAAALDGLSPLRTNYRRGRSDIPQASFSTIYSVSERCIREIIGSTP